MTNLQDLRETLHSHADLDDHAGTTRAAAVHDRVRAVHRRRRAAIAGGAAALLVGAVVAFNLPDGKDPAPAGPPGLVPPKTITSTGYTYELQATSSGEHQVTVRIPRSDRPMLISWGTEAGVADPVRVRPPDGEPFTSAASAFDDFYVTYPGERGALRIAGAEGDVAVSAYVLSGEAPEGVTNDGSTFRQKVGIWRLASAEIGDVGDPEVAFDVTLPSGSGPVRLADFCAGVPRGYWVNVSVAGKAPNYAEGCQGAGFDPGAGNSSTDFRGGFGTPGSTVRLRTWISKAGGSTEVVKPSEVPDVRLGLGLYGTAPEYSDVKEDEPEPVVESGGHTWQQVSGAGRSGAEPLTLDVPGSGAHLLMYYFDSPVHVTYRVTVDGREVPEAALGSGPGAGLRGDIVIPAGASKVGVVASGASERTETTLALYEEID